MVIKLFTSLPCPLTQILLLIASACGIVYSNRTFGMDGRATFFAGVSTFCWVMVIVLQMGFLLGIQKDQRYFKTPSYSTLIVSIATNSFPIIHGCDTHIRPFPRCLKTLCENGSVFVGSLWKVLRRKAASFLYFRYKSFHKKGFVLLTFGTRSGILYHWSGKGTFSTI